MNTSTNHESVMPAMNKDRWVCATLILRNNFDEMMHVAMAPFIQEVMEEGHATDFIYRTLGANIDRLSIMFRTTPVSSETFIKPRLYAVVEKYLERYDEDERKVFDLNDGTSPYIHKNVDYIDYYLINLAALHTAQLANILIPASSKIILQFIKEFGSEWNSEVALEKAIALNLTFAHSFGMSYYDMHMFYSYAFKKMMSTAILYGGENTFWNSEFEIIMENNFNDQKDMLIGYSRFLIENMEEEEAFEEGWIDEWKKICKLGKTEVLTLQATGKLFPPATLIVDPVIGIEKQQIESWPFLEGYLRIMNSQLGIGYLLEFTLFYALKESAKYLHEESQVQ